MLSRICIHPPHFVDLKGFRRNEAHEGRQSDIEIDTFKGRYVVKITARSGYDKKACPRYEWQKKANEQTDM